MAATTIECITKVAWDSTSTSSTSAAGTIDVCRLAAGSLRRAADTLRKGRRIQPPPCDAKEWACPTCGGDILLHLEREMRACRNMTNASGEAQPTCRALDLAPPTGSLSARTDHLSR